MAESIKCPVCGENNPADQENCRKCNSPLQPFGVAGAAFAPGQIPTKKNTAELEPILPQWLKDARDQARQTAIDDTSEPVKPPPSPTATPSHASGLDLLAGLQSQKGDDEDETPDWLASITGVSNKSKKQESNASDVRWVELGGKEESPLASGSEQEDESPSWLKNLQSQPADETDELQGWLGQPSSGESNSASNEDAPSWLNPSVEKALSSSNDDSPDWLKQMDAPAESSTPAVNLNDSSFGDAPDWLRQMSSTDSPDTTNGGTPLWSTDSDAGTSAFAGSVFGEAEAGLSSSSDEADDWLKGLQEKQAGDENPFSSTPALQETDTPAEEPLLGDIPNWLKAAAPQSSIFADETSAEQNVASAGDTPEWLAAFRVDTPESQSASPFESNDQQNANASAPAFETGSFGGNSDVLFSADMPDWLTGASDSSASAEPETTASTDSLTPSNLPSWVQAMRPVDTGAGRAGPLSTDQTMETKGALAGLQGVLPAVPGYAPSSKPKAYSIKLQATEEQQAHALLLEQILAAETEPQPIASFSPLAASLALRLSLTLIFFLVLPAVLFLRTQLFLTPFISLDTSNSFSNALVAAQNVPQAAPVLVVLDYQPATIGEMEAAAAPMFDHMYLLRHPRLVFISTNEMGTVLAERFMSLLRDDMNIYKDDATQLANLGYLPGGEMGIRSFMQNPLETMPSGAGVLQQNIPLTQFATVIVVTDNASSARAWVEQTTAFQYPFPVVFVSSTQATPMIQPYYDSGQITGIVSGLRGGAVFEEINAKRPGTARYYWDAYSIGILIAVITIFAGGLWNLFAGLRARSVTGAA